MNCKRAQGQIALAVGGDLDDASERDLRKHLADCSGCQRHWEQMHNTWSLLLERDDELPDPHDSVWPEVEVRLPSRRDLLSRAQFNGWVVAVAVAGVCLAMVSMWRTAHTPEPSLGTPGEFAGTLNEFPRSDSFPDIQDRFGRAELTPVGDEMNWNPWPGAPAFVPHRPEPPRQPGPRLPMFQFPMPELP
jgi:Putative zinc-finger